MRILLLLAACLAVGLALAQPAPPFLGDYDAEPRLANGHVDHAALLQALKDLHANTYMWLIWHQATDWEDLQAFLPLAKQAGITVWAYLVPHSETALANPQWPYSEPFKLDYVRWAQEIGKLSRRYDNLVGYVIDDFGYNTGPDRFSPDYLKRMVAAGKAENPKLRFYPLLYYRELTLRVLSRLGPLVDGIVAAYPQSREEVLAGLVYLNDEARAWAGAQFVYPAATPSKPGDRGFLSQEAEVTDAARARVKFRYLDDYDGPTTGYHVLQVRVDDHVVWEQDAGGQDRGEAEVDLGAAVAGKARARLSFGVYDKNGVAEFALYTEFSGLEVAGLKLAEPNFSAGAAWQAETVGAFQAACFARDPGAPRHKVPLIIMPAGSRGEYAHRYQDGPTPENLAARVRMSTDLLAEGKVEGVVIYCLDKTPGNPDLRALGQVFADFWARPRR